MGNKQGGPSKTPPGGMEKEQAAPAIKPKSPPAVAAATESIASTLARSPSSDGEEDGGAPTET